MLITFQKTPKIVNNPTKKTAAAERGETFYLFTLLPACVSRRLTGGVAAFNQPAKWAIIGSSAECWFVSFRCRR
jgi:hypothetical protein